MVAMRRRRSLARVRRALDHIEANPEDPIRLTELAGMAAISTFHFCRLFKIGTGVTPMRYLLERRVRMAKKMLRETDLMHATIAHACGFSSESQFCTSFKAVTGRTPGMYRFDQK